MTRALTSLFACATIACGTPSTCPVDAGADVGSAPLDAPPDAGLLDAGSLDCDPIEPVALMLDQTWFAFGAADTRTCAFPTVRVRVFVPGASDPIVDTMDIAPLNCTTSIDYVPRGTYDLAVESIEHPEWITGGALTGRSTCVGALARAPHCQPTRLVVDGCDEHRFFAVLHCDPGSGSCPPSDFPW